MTLEEVKARAESFFDWPTEDRLTVTTTSACLFARAVAQVVQDEMDDLRAAVLVVLKENANLSDGDNCTLKLLKDALENPLSIIRPNHEPLCPKCGKGILIRKVFSAAQCPKCQEILTTEDLECHGIRIRDIA